MKKEFNQMVKAIEVTKRYTSDEVKKLADLFLYLNDTKGVMDEYRYGVSAKGLRKLLHPLTRTGKVQKFDDWRRSVSNIARLKEANDYIRIESISKVESQFFEVSEISETPKKGRGGARNAYGKKEVDYILTLRAGEYCATLTKGDAGDLYRRFIFDIKDEFIRLVFRRGRSVDTRVEFTTAIGKLPFVKALSSKEQGRIYAKFTNQVYLNLEDVEMEAKAYKQKHGISKRAVAKHYFKRDGLLDLEKIESKLATIIAFAKPDSEEGLETLFEQFFVSLSE